MEIEKHGALWRCSDADSKIIFERFDPASELIGVLYRERERHYRAETFKRVRERGSRPAVWRWKARFPDCLTDNEPDALSYLEKCFTNAHR